MPVDQFVQVLHALTNGLLYPRFLTSELITADVIIAAFEALAWVAGSGPHQQPAGLKQCPSCFFAPVCYACA